MRPAFLRFGLALFGFVVGGRLAAQVPGPLRLSSVAGGGSVELGQRVVLTSVFSLTPDPGTVTYQWSKDGANLAGATASFLAIDPVAATDAGTYAVVATNAGGSSTAITGVSVKPAAAPVIAGTSRDTSADVGQSVAFGVSLTGSFPRTYQWRKDGNDLPGATSSVFAIGSLSLADAGAYSVRVSNPYGSATSGAITLTVSPTRIPVPGNFSPASQTFVQGRAATISPPAIGGSTPFTYQWLRDGAVIAGATNAALNFASIALTDAGKYSVSVTNAAGTATSGEVELLVQPAKLPFKIHLRNIAQPLGVDFALGDTASLFENQPTTYQWYKDGQPIPGATQSSYALRQPTSVSAGAYFVVATNVVGSTTSETAMVSFSASTPDLDHQWLATERNGDTVYFAFANPARIERYNLAADAWLPAIPLSRTPTAFTAAGNALYIAFGASVSRLALDGTGESAVTSATLASVSGLRVAGSFLLVSEGDGATTSVRLSDGAKIATASGYPYHTLYPPLTFVPGARRIYGHNSRFAEAAFRAIVLAADGTFGPVPTAPDIDWVRIRERFFLSPNEQYIANEDGIAFRASDQNFAAGLGGALDDLDYTAAGNAVVLRGADLRVFDAQFNDTGGLTAPFAAKRLYVRGTDAFVFGWPDATGAIPRARLSLAQAQPRPVAAPLNPAGLGFTPDAVLLDRDGVALLYSKVSRQVFRWSTTDRRFLASIALSGWPNAVGYSPAIHRLYLGHADGRLTQVKLDTGSLTEEAFATAPEWATAAEGVGSNIFACTRPLTQYSPSYPVYLLYGPDGRTTAITSGNYSEHFTWSDAARRLYYFQDDLFPNNLLSLNLKTDATFGARTEVSDRLSVGTAYPIRVSPTTPVSVLLGAGQFFDGTTLAQTYNLPHACDEAEWLGSRPVTARLTVRGIEVERWGGANFTLDRTALLTGRLLRLLALAGSRLLAVTVADGLVYLTILDQDLNVLSRDSVGAPNRLANLSARALAGQGDQALVPGFVISGNDPKTVLIRAAGPALAGFGVPGALVDPILTIYNSTGTVVATNDNWSSGTNLAFLGPVTTRVGAFGLVPGSRDAAALVTLAPGAYTARVSGAGNTTGVALVEVYDAQDNLGASRLVNIATRAQVGTDGDILITGLVVQGTAPRTVLVRAVGPALAAFGVSGLLANPKLRLFKDGQLLGENDDWGDGGADAAAQISAAATKAGAFALPAGSRDSALLLTLPAGAFSVQVSGADGGTGVALVETYEVP